MGNSFLDIQYYSGAQAEGAWLGDDTLLAPVDVHALVPAVLVGNLVALLLHQRLALLHIVGAAHLHDNIIAVASRLNINASSGSE